MCLANNKVSIYVGDHVTVNNVLLPVTYPTLDQRKDLVRAMRLWNSRNARVFEYCNRGEPGILVAWTDAALESPLVVTNAHTQVTNIVIPINSPMAGYGVVAIAHGLGVTAGLPCTTSKNSIMNPLSLGTRPMFVMQYERSLAYAGMHSACTVCKIAA